MSLVVGAVGLARPICPPWAGSCCLSSSGPLRCSSSLAALLLFCCWASLEWEPVSRCCWPARAACPSQAACTVLLLLGLPGVGAWKYVLWTGSYCSTASGPPRSGSTVVGAVGRLVLLVLLGPLALLSWGPASRCRRPACVTLLLLGLHGVGAW